jgi:hypothetical protein
MVYKYRTEEIFIYLLGLLNDAVSTAWVAFCGISTK